MALQKAKLKEILSEAGCDVEKIGDAVEQILAGHVATVEALKEQISTLQSDLDQAKVDQKELEDLKKSNGDISSLQKEFDEYKAKVEADKDWAKKESAYRKILKACGVAENHLDRVVKYSKDEINAIEFDDQGNVKGEDEIRKSIEAEWSDRIEHEGVEGIKTPNPPANGGQKTTMTKEQIRAISDPQARQKAMLENPSLFGLPE